MIGCVMITNSFFKNANSSELVSALFGTRNNASSSYTNTQNFGSGRAVGGNYTYDTTAQTALAKIVMILAGVDTSGNGSSNGSSVDSQNGNIMSAKGTNDGEQMDFKTNNVYHVDAGKGDDTINISGSTTTDIQGGDGNDRLNIMAKTATDLGGGAGNDVINFAGTFAQNISGGDGADTLRIKSDTILNANGGAGNDTLVLEGKKIVVSGGAGNDAISIKNTGKQAAEVQFVKGDGQDTITTNGPLNIRFGSMSGLGNGKGFTPQDLTYTTANNSIVIKSNTGPEQITVSFDAGALNGTQPKVDFVFDKGSWLMKLS